MRRICGIGLALVVVLTALGCQRTPTPTPTTLPPTVTPTALPSATPTPAPTATATPVPLQDGATVHLGVDAGDVYVIATGVVDRERGLVYVLGQEGDARTTGGVLSVVDLSAKQVRASAPLPALFDSFSKMILSADGSRLYIAGSSSGPTDQGLYVISTGVGTGDLGDVLGRVPNVRTMALNAAKGQLFVLEPTRLRRLDSVTLEEQASTPVAEVPPIPPAVFLVVNDAADRVYLSENNGAFLDIYRATDLLFQVQIQPGGQIISLESHPDLPQVYAVTQTFGGTEIVTRVAVVERDEIVRTLESEPPISIGQVVVNPETGNLLLAGDATATDNPYSQIRIVDPATGNLVRALTTAYANLRYARALFVYDDALYWIAEALRPISLETGDIGQPIQLGIILVDMSLDESSERLFVMDSTGSIHVVNAATFQKVDIFRNVLEPGLLGTVRSDISVAQGKLYVPAFEGPPDPGTTLVLNAATGEQIATIARAGQVTTDPARNRLFLTNQGVYIVDATTYEITGSIEETLRSDPFLVTPGAIRAQYDAQHDLLFVIMSNNSPGSSSSTYLFIYDGATLERVKRDVRVDQQFLSGLAIGPDRIWLSGAFPTSTLLSYDLDGNLLVRLRGVGGSLFLDQARALIYVNGWGGLLAFDTISRTIIHYRSLDIQFPSQMLYDSARRRFYVTASESSNVTLILPDVQPPLRGEAFTSLPERPVEQIAFGADGALLAVTRLPPFYEPGLFRANGQNWLRLQGGLPAGIDLRIVPAPGSDGEFWAFSTDVNRPFGLFRSTDRGSTWQVASQGLTDFRVQRLALSPNFDNDRTGLAVATSTGVFRATDGGDTWTLVAPYMAYGVASALSPSGQPTFMLLVQDPENGGQTLTYTTTGPEGAFERVGLLVVPAPFVQDFALSPAFAVDGVGLVAMAQQGLFLTEDGGRMWRRVGPVPEVFYPGYTILFARDFARSRTVYVLLEQQFFGPRNVATLLRSTDGGRNWERALDFDESVSAMTMDAEGQLWAGNALGEVTTVNPFELNWEIARQPTPTPTPAPMPTPAPTPTPVGVGTPPAGLYRPVGAFAEVWTDDITLRQSLGWATEPQPHETGAALQPFQNGYMIWRGDSRQIYALYADGSWDNFEDTWEPPQPESDPSITPPAGLLQPIRGFGKVWRENPQVRDRLGWALENERGGTATIQAFQRGLLVRLLDRTFALIRTDGAASWQELP